MNQLGIRRCRPQGSVCAELHGLRPSFDEIEATWTSGMAAAKQERKADDPFGVRLPGSTELEKLSAPASQLTRIAKLAKNGSDRRAVSELANAWRVTSLHRPLERAMDQVGWRSISSMIRSRPGAWPEGLPELAERKVREDEDKRSGPSAMPKGDHHFVYFLADW